ncbi:MAG: hypothetical protein WAM02_08980, partial [Candidatus Cybelea sp.]
MAGKVRIFELAKEVGLTSKELTALFNDRLGGVFEAKNQLSVVPDQIADLVRTVLLKSVEKPPARPKTSPASASATAAKTAVKPAAAKKPAATSAPAPTTAPVARL